MDKVAALVLIRKKAKDMEVHGYPEFAEILDNLADQIEDLPDEVATREKVFTQIHKDSPIAYPTWKCSYCGFEERQSKGKHCRMCGRRFEE